MAPTNLPNVLNDLSGLNVLNPMQSVADPLYHFPSSFELGLYFRAN
jgi:hypothetical protein